MKKALVLLALLPIVFSGCQLFPFQEDEAPPTTGIYRSDDNGVTWQYISNPDRNSSIPAADSFSLSDDPQVHSVLFAGVGERGIYKTWDGGNDWDTLNRGLPAARSVTINQVTFDPRDTNTVYLIGTFDDIGRVVRGENGGENWENLYADLDNKTAVNFLTVDPKQSDILYATNTDKAFLKSEDRGKTWKALHWFDDIPSEIIVYAKDPRTIFVTERSKGLMRSKDGGVNWEQIVTDQIKQKRKWSFGYTIGEEGEYIYTPVPFPKVNMLAISPHDDETMFLATAQGVYYSENLGEDWNVLTKVLPIQEADIKAFTFHPTDAKIIYLASGDNLYITYNLGESWDVKKIKINEDIEQIVVDKMYPDTIYVGVGTY